MGRPHITALDGLRGVAILLVLGIHAPTKPLIDGFVGVTVFFALSGYLITSILLAELDRGGISLRGFYRRRVARLSPGLLVMLAVTVAVVVLRGTALVEALKSAAASALYVMNLLLSRGRQIPAGDYFSFTWTLAVEEQFYLFWPLLLLVGYRRAPRSFAAATALLAAASATTGVVLAVTRSVPFEKHSYYGSDTNALPILLGALVAMGAHQGWFRRREGRGTVVVGAVALVGLLPLAWYDQTRHVGLATVTASVLTTVVLLALVTQPASTLSSALSWTVLTWFGARSYSLYLWNILALITVLEVVGVGYVEDLLWLVLTLATGEVSYRLVEQPARRRLSGARGYGQAKSSNAAEPT